ncbi:RNA polymerase sigma factor, sigma-70 family [Parapedobacter indicus]|uniref:RNA polymerase sigma factor, sigma-70 family n=2 Tax=Parapedobacter indicus TaxID=1477437 RepID=A0A1I3GXT7_9SPHI|nr:RNA polymerase sigma factor (sigma-70 family) [Parapedobacter indicus]SFI28122.1 RNA polymerase sigma factor, sigma-70 family [Parapedobacter indicus]
MFGHGNCKRMRGEIVDTIKQYWRHFLNGDDEAFKRLYDHYIDTLFGWGCRYCRDEETIKDCIQELFVDLYTYRKRLCAETDIDAYLFVSFRRKLAKQLKRSRDLQTVNENFAVEQLVEQLIEEDVEQETIREEESRRLMAALKKEVVELPSRQQEVLFLRYTSELSYDSVSKIMKIPIPTCRTLLSRALRQLRKRMKPA